jgi:hypothetical protein
MKPLISRNVRIIIGGIVVLMLGALTGWYFYLHGEQTSLNSIDQATGLGAAAPSFGGTGGSTQADQAVAAQAFGSPSQGSAATSSSQLWEVDSSPVAGMGFVVTGAGEYLYYAERGNGYIFSADPYQETSVRLTDTLMPKIYQALFANDGSVIERSIDTNGNVTTFLGEVSSSSAATSSAQETNVQAAETAEAANAGVPDVLAGAYMQTGIQQIAIDPVSKALFYLVPDPKGGVDGITQQWDGAKQAQIFSSAVGSWLPYFLSDGSMVILESPADGIPGYAYAVSAKGALTPLVRNVDGLTILPKASSPFLIYGSSSGVALSLYGATTSTPELLSLATVADKCVWLPGQSEVAYCAVPNGTVPQDFLDNWYKGTVDTSDDWWEIDLSTGQAQRFYSPSADNRSLDVEDPTIDPTGNYIAFINGSDQSLWILRVTQ